MHWTSSSVYHPLMRLCKEGTAMDKNLLTEATRNLLEERKGYRVNGLFGDGVIEIDQICIYETFKLGNTDIPHTLLRLYAAELTETEKGILSFCEAEDHGEAAEFKPEFASIVLRIAQKVTGKEHPISRWFAAYETVAEYYQQGNGDTEHIEAYDLPERVCILSDIGYDGALIAY